MMIAFSTQPGNVALDRNSPFAGALLRHIGTEGLSINDAMIDLRNDVLRRPTASVGEFLVDRAILLQKPRPRRPSQTRPPEPPRRSPHFAKRSTSSKRTKVPPLPLNRSSSRSPRRRTSPKPRPPANSPPRPPIRCRLPPLIALLRLSRPATPSLNLISQLPTQSSQPPRRAAEPGKAPEVLPPSSPPLPAGVTRAELAEDIVSELKDLDCYRGPVNGSWGRSAQDALERFNSLAKLDLPVDDPEEGTLAALEDRKGR